MESKILAKLEWCQDPYMLVLQEERAGSGISVPCFLGPRKHQLCLMSVMVTFLVAVAETT